MTNETKHQEHHHKAHIKINGAEHETHRGRNSVEHLRRLGAIPDDEILSLEIEGRQVDLEDKGDTDVLGGEVFISHKKHHRHHEVPITINGVEQKTHAGKNSVEHLKNLGNVPEDEILAEFKNHEFVDLGNEAHVEIHGGEVFVSHHHGAPVVEVTNLNTNDTVKFHAKWEETLQQVWTTAYGKLKESLKPGDELLCEGGPSLMGYLNLTLAQLRDQKICPHRKYQIRRATGGA